MSPTEELRWPTAEDEQRSKLLRPLDEGKQTAVVEFYTALVENEDSHDIPPKRAAAIMAQYLRSGTPVSQSRAATLADYELGSRDFSYTDAADIFDLTPAALRTGVNDASHSHEQDRIRFFQTMEQRPVEHLFHSRFRTDTGEFNRRIDGSEIEVHVDLYRYGDVVDDDIRYPDDIGPVDDDWLPRYALVMTKTQQTGLYYGGPSGNEDKRSRDNYTRDSSSHHVPEQESRNETELAGVDITRVTGEDELLEQTYQKLHDSGLDISVIREDIQSIL